MMKALSSKGIVLVLLILSINSFASQSKIDVLQPCNIKNAYNVNSLCIDGEKITRKNFLDTYGGDGVEHRTKSDKYTNITSKIVNNQSIWELTNKNGLTYTYSTSDIPQLSFTTVTYTGNGTSQDIVTGIGSVDFTKPNNGSGYWHDRASGDGTVKDDAGNVVESGNAVVNISKVHIKERDTNNYHNAILDGLRGSEKVVYTDRTVAESGLNDTTVTPSPKGLIINGHYIFVNENGKKYVAYQTLYTHVKWGATNQGKKYIEAYNPMSKETMILYEGSNVSGHEVPHSLDTKLSFATSKNLVNAYSWGVMTDTKTGFLDLANAFNNSNMYRYFKINKTFFSNGSSFNGMGTYIFYGKSKSKTQTIGTYTGTGAAGNFIETKDVNGVAKKPARVIIKRLNSAESWGVFDNKRTDDGYPIYLNLSNAEQTATDYVDFTSNGFTLNTSSFNPSSEQILYLVDFDTKADGGGSYTTEEVFTQGEKVYRLVNIKNSSTSINLPYTNSEITLSFEKSADQQVLSQIITTDKHGVTSFHDVNYDGNMVATITGATEAKNLTNYLSKTYNYDNNGKILRQSVSGTDIEPRVTKYEYKELDSTYSKKEINPLGHITTKIFDLNGNLISFSDANGLVTTYTYDSQNRVTLETKADENTITYVYSTDDLITDAVYKATITSSVDPEIVKYYDAKNRKIQTAKIGFNGRYVLEDVVYDEEGRIASYSLPYFKGEIAYFINLSYDAQNRIITVDKPSSNEQRAVTTYAYNEDGTISITYPDNRVKTVKENGKLDNITYTYDVIGNLITTLDSNEKTTNTSYDELNRVVKKEILLNETQDTTYYVYDRANNGIGKLAYTKSGEYKKEYFYDEFSRLKANKELIGNKTFATQYTYLANGKLDYTISPDGFKSINEYNEYGYLSAIKSSKTNASELSFTDLQDLITTNLTNEYILYTQYLELKAKVKYYSLKKIVYETIAPQYAVVDVSIQNQLNAVSTLLGETIVLLNQSISEYESVLANYKSIRENQLLAELTNSSNEDNFKWLNETMDSQAKQYAALATTYIDKSTLLLEGIITTPSLLEDNLNIDQDLVAYYKNQADEIVAFANGFNQLSINYFAKYIDLKNGNGSLQDNAYLGMFDNTEFKYFYKIIDEDPLGRVTNEIYGNGLVTKKEYDNASGNLLRITTGYYGNNDIRDIQYTYDKSNNIVTKYDVKQDFTQTYKYDVSNRLISASNVGESFYVNLAYTYIDPSQSVYTYDSSNNTFTKTTDNTLVSLNRPNSIEKNLLKVETLYSGDGQSYKKTTSIDTNSTTSYKIDKNFKYNLDDGDVTYKNLIYVKGNLVAIHVEEDIGGLVVPNNYYLHKDQFGSLDAITNEAAIIEENLNYRPFGETSDVSWSQALKPTKDITSVGYKSFEHNYEFGLIDMNGYMYDPVVGKSLSDKLFIYANPTTYMDNILENWNRSFLNITEAKPLYNIEMSREINSLSSFSNVHIGTQSPTDTTKIWYKPNESGALDISIYNNGNWESMGSTGSIDSQGSITANSVEQLNTMPCFYRDNGFVNLQNGKKSAYTCTSNQTWQLGGEFVGTYTVVDMATTYNAATEGSKITATSSGFTGTKEFSKTGSIWKANTIQVANNPSGRDSFTTLNSSFTYYLVNNDCTSSTCNGDIANEYYGGEKIDNLFTFRYLTTGNRKNNLTDAIPISSITQMYVDAPIAASFNSQIYTKTADNKGNSCYKREDGAFITKANATLPSAFVEGDIVNLPINDSCENALFTNNALVLANYTEATDWADAPNSVKVSISAKEYTHKVSGVQDFWSDNSTGDGQVSATLIFTKGDRGNFPTVTHSLTAITKQLGSQENYTTTGVIYSEETSFKQWVYSNTGTRTNNLLDGAVLEINSAINGTYNISNEVTSKYGSTIPYVVLNVNANITATHGVGSAGHSASGIVGSALTQNGGHGLSAIEIGSFPSGTNISINNNAVICAGGGGGSGGFIRDWTGGNGGSIFSNGTKGLNNGKGGLGGNCGQGGGSGAIYWSDRGYLKTGYNADKRNGAIKNIEGLWNSSYTGSGGNGGCAIEIPSSSLNGVVINISNSGTIAGAVQNDMLNWNYNDIWHNGLGYCYK